MASNDFKTRETLIMTPKEIEDLRDSLEMSVPEFCEVCDVTRQTYYNWVRLHSEPTGASGRFLGALKWMVESKRYHEWERWRRNERRLSTSQYQ